MHKVQQTNLYIDKNRVELKVEKKIHNSFEKLSSVNILPTLGMFLCFNFNTFYLKFLGIYTKENAVFVFFP